ncbi:MAG: hypothetical protein EZS26_000171 [Candidatus Ordinivivax streblomastigis]|uniref:Uncharacterized protein n=1 Tax=Candidatus Ordinivivax streblomastigis TaxID=2540710 RepID=A0A5M8P5X3_9BACT|nr:MAG: hypothetical protein EZS26_000171 [Candidatus Ordinivivax streblomastigis]
MKQKQYWLLIIVGFLIIGSSTLNAQGIFSESNERHGSTEISNESSSSALEETVIFSSGNLRIGADQGDPGTANPGSPDPIGGGLLTLMLLAGGYVATKRKNSQKTK